MRDWHQFDWSEESFNLWSRALSLGLEAHDGQRRKYTNQPYFESHCLNVAYMVAQYTDDIELVAAAMLHDVLEDTDTDYNTIREVTSARVAELVFELTKEYTKNSHPTLNRNNRHRLEVQRIKNLSHDAKFIKRFDIADNVSDIVLHDPQFAAIYLREKADELDAIS